MISQKVHPIRNGACLTALVVVGLLLFSWFQPALAGEQLSVAPVNPALTEYLENRSLSMVQTFTEEGYPLGYVPPPLKLPKAPALDQAMDVPTALPAKFDLRTAGGVTAVEDQGACGSCWTFASLGSLTSYLKYKKTQTWNFSEADLNQYHGWGFRECEGGNEFISTAYLARWSGPVNEEDVPYPYASTATPGVEVKKHVQNVWFLPDRSSYTDNTLVKNAIMTYGGVYVSFQYESAYYNSTNKAYCINKEGGNHAVLLVGWDDNFSKDKFNTIYKPPANGAFIVKNSWGTGWGENGYFYISYYDQSLSVGALFYNAEGIGNYKRAYEYDPLGWTSSVGYGGGTPTVGWFANIFKAASTAPVIKAVSFYTPVPSCPYTIYIYKDVEKGKPRSGILIKTLKGTMPHGGYHTVSFGSSPATVNPGKRFSVVVKLTTPGYNWPIPIEGQYDWSPGANAYTGQSFVSATGTGWSDLTSNEGFERANVCLKAFGAAR